MQRTNRMKKELEILQTPSPGISCWPCSEHSLDHFKAQIVGGDGTPYKGGVFHLDITIPDRYPMQPPRVQFTTSIYHPNVDTAGRICLDLLKMPPAGSWKPSWNLSTMLTSIQLLMSSPNPDDPLMVDIATEFKHNRAQYTAKAREWTRKYATDQEATEFKHNRAQYTAKAREWTRKYATDQENNNNKESESSSDESDLSDTEPTENQPRRKLMSRNTAVKRVLKEHNSLDQPKKERL